MMPHPEAHPQLLEAAVRGAIAEAKRGASATPPVAPPRAIEPFLRFKRLPSAAVETVLRVLDDDAAFRNRVVDSTDETAVGAVGWLWLARPDGWIERYTGLAEAAMEVASARSGVAAERSAMQRLPKLQKVADDQRARLTSLEQELADQQALTGELVDRLDDAQATIAEMTTRLEGLTADRQRAVRELKDTEQKFAERTAELRTARTDLARAEHAVDQQRRTNAPTAPIQATTSPEPPVENPPEQPAPEPAPALPPPVNRDAIASQVRAAAAHAEGLSAALASIADHVAEPVVDLNSPTPSSSSGRVTGDDARRIGARGTRSARRRPPPLPGGIRDDGVEAVAHWMRVPGVVFIVDGYNVSNTAWGNQPPREQRQRLERILNELALRHGTRFDVVYDGAFDRPSSLRAVHSSVQLRFTEAGVEADDVIIATVPGLPEGVPAVVVSSDRRVRDGSQANGAAVVHARILLQAAGVPIAD